MNTQDYSDSLCNTCTNKRSVCSSFFCNLPINCEMAVYYGTIPYFMITFSEADESTTMFF